MAVRDSQLPFFLESFENLTTHFDEHFEDLAGTARGDQFVKFAQRLVPLTEEGSGFGELEPAPKKTHDDGVDMLTAMNEAGEQLFAQRAVPSALSILLSGAAGWVGGAATASESPAERPTSAN